MKIQLMLKLKDYKMSNNSVKSRPLNENHLIIKAERKPWVYTPWEETMLEMINLKVEFDSELQFYLDEYRAKDLEEYGREIEESQLVERLREYYAKKDQSN